MENESTIKQKINLMKAPVSKQVFYEFITVYELFRERYPTTSVEKITDMSHDKLFEIYVLIQIKNKASKKQLKVKQVDLLDSIEECLKEKENGK